MSALIDTDGNADVIDAIPRSGVNGEKKVGKKSSVDPKPVQRLVSGESVGMGGGRRLGRCLPKFQITYFLTLPTFLCLALAWKEAPEFIQTEAWKALSIR